MPTETPPETDALVRELTELRKRVAELERSDAHLDRRMLQIRLSLIEYAGDHPLNALLMRALDEVGALVDSPIGFYHFVESDQKTLSLQQWSTRTLEEFCTAEGGGLHYDIDQAGVWVECVRLKRPVIHNDYALLPNKKGLPEGHARVIRELVVPVMRKDKVVAILGVGNKSTEYTEKDVETVAYIADVTWEIIQQKRWEEAVVRERDRAEKYLEIAGVLFIVLDTNGTVTLANRKACETLGYEPEDIIGSNWFERFLPERMREMTRNVFSRLIAGEIEPVEYYENPVLTKRGEERIIAWHNSLLTDENGTITGSLSSGEDVTDRKRAEEALEKRILALTLPMDEDIRLDLDDLFNLADIQKLQDEFADATGVASIITHPDGTPITRPSNFCRLCNDIIRTTEQGRLNCYQSDAAIGRLSPDGPVIQPCMSGGLWDAGAAIAVGGRHVASWLIGQVRDDTQTEENIREYARSIGADEDAAAEAFREVTAMSRERFERIGKVLFTLANQLSSVAYQNIQQARFITDLKRAEVDLARLNADLSAKNDELEQVVYVASHDLRSPLVNIDGYSRELEYAVEDLRRVLDDSPAETKAAAAPLLDEDITEALHFIRTSASKMDTLLMGLLKLSRSGRAALTIEPLDMNRLVSKVVDTAEFQIREAGIEVTVDDLPSCVGDAIQVNQVFSNLLDNARKYLDPDRAGIIRVSGRVEGERSVYCVEDNGIGIATDHLDKVFEIFHRLDPRNGKGEGLGLTIVSRILGRLGGDIRVESTPGSGSRFYVGLPTGEGLQP